MASKKQRKPFYLEDEWEESERVHRKEHKRMEKAFGYPITMRHCSPQPMELDYLFRLIPDKPEMLFIGQRLAFLFVHLN